MIDAPNLPEPTRPGNDMSGSVWMVKENHTSAASLCVSIAIALALSAQWLFGGAADSRNTGERVLSLSKQVEQINAKIDLLPRAGDFTERDRRLSVVEARLDQQEGRIGRAEAIHAAMQATLNSLTDGTQARIRTPR